MAIEFLNRCDVIEECYEFLLGYAAQGLPSDDGSSVGKELRRHLEKASEALLGLVESYKQSIANHELEPAEKYVAFCVVLDRDTRDSIAAVNLVLAQPSISSQLVDNLNASSHLRALLTDLFLIGEILRTREKTTAAAEEI
jgi:tRNA uridine 5-carbamoylmethylation protein Kti12